VQGLGQGTAGHHVSAQIANATTDAYVAALQTGLRVSAVVAVIGAILAFVLVRGRPTQTQSEPTVGEHVAESELAAQPRAPEPPSRCAPAPPARLTHGPAAPPF